MTAAADVTCIGGHGSHGRLDEANGKGRTSTYWSKEGVRDKR